MTSYSGILRNFLMALAVCFCFGSIAVAQTVTMTRVTTTGRIGRVMRLAIHQAEHQSAVEHRAQRVHNFLIPLPRVRPVHRAQDAIAAALHREMHIPAELRQPAVRGDEIVLEAARMR